MQTKFTSYLTALPAKLSLIFAILFVISMAGVSIADCKYRRAIYDPLGQQRSYVYDVHGPYVVRGAKIHLPSLRKILNTGVKKVACMEKSEQAGNHCCMKMI